MKSFTIQKNDSGQRLDKFIHKAVPNLPQSLLYKYIRTKRIKLNRKRAEISTKLREGDLLELYINDEFFIKSQKMQYDFLRSPKELDILYEDENILLLNKKVGELCHPDGHEYVDTLIGSVKRYLYEKKEYNPDEENSFVPSLVNRIDRNTGGIVIAAKNATALRVLNQKMKDREMHKFYLCIVGGTPSPAAATLQDYLEKDTHKNTVRVTKKPTPDSKEIRTKYKVIDTVGNLSLVEIELLTGRTHQIRAHMAFYGHPLLGDSKYTTQKFKKQYANYKHQFLYSYKIAFDFTSDAESLAYLNGKVFQTDNIPFVANFYKGKL